VDPDPRSRIRCLFGPLIRDPGSQIHIFQSLVLIFGVKSTVILCKFKISQKFCLFQFRNKIILNFMIFVVTKNGRTPFFPPPPPPGFGFRDTGWIKIRIRDKHPGSATLVNLLKVLKFSFSPSQKSPCSTYH
jgi:hypothetical protein